MAFWDGTKWAEPTFGDANDPSGQAVNAYQATLTPEQLAIQAQGQAARDQQNQAYGFARDAALGMFGTTINQDPNSPDYAYTGGLGAVSDPSAALKTFEDSGYTGQQAMSDGWLTGLGTAGWQSPFQQGDANGSHRPASMPAPDAQPYTAPPATDSFTAPTAPPPPMSAPTAPPASTTAQPPTTPATAPTPPAQTPPASTQPLDKPQWGNADANQASMNNLYGQGTGAGAKVGTQSKFDPNQNAMKNMYTGSY